MEAQSLAQVDTEYSADSIEFCPRAGYERVFVCGTYQLLDAGGGLREAPASGAEAAAAELEALEIREREKEQGGSGSGREGGEVEREDEDDEDEDKEETPTAEAPRVGRLYLFSLDSETPVETQRIDTAAILDAKWSRNDDAEPELAVADAKGGVTFFSLSSDPKPALVEKQRLEFTDESTLVLSLDYAPTPERRGEVIASLSSGELAHLVPSETGMEVVETWAAHDFEPWITAWDGVDPNTVWSGGDDCKLKRWDVRMPEMPTFVNLRFDAGVTTIAPSPHTPHLLAVGSYDAHLRLFDARAPAKPLLELELPGGIWRTRWHPSPARSGDILNACMQGGFAVVRLGQDEAGAQGDGADFTQGTVVKTFPGVLGYGADWSRIPVEDGGESIVATCSFYDHVMHVWRA